MQEQFNYPRRGVGGMISDKDNRFEPQYEPSRDNGTVKPYYHPTANNENLNFIKYYPVRTQRKELKVRPAVIPKLEFTWLYNVILRRQEAELVKLTYETMEDLKNSTKYEHRTEESCAELLAIIDQRLEKYGMGPALARPHFGS